MRQQVAIGIQHGKIFLVRLHGGNQGLGGHCQKFLVKMPQHGHRPFDDVVDFIQQGRINHGLAAVLRRQGFNLLVDGVAAGVAGHLHLVLLQLFLPLAGRCHSKGFGGVKTVTIAGVTSLMAKKFSGNDLIIGHQYDPVYGPDKGEIVPAPAHGLGDGQFTDGLADDVRQ